jgi:hypothetical protein
MESWNNGVWPPACSANDSKREIEKWVVMEIHYDIKDKNDHKFGNFSLSPTFHHSIIPRFLFTSTQL